MNEIKNKENEKIENMIYEIRGMQVMLDSDLATLYQCKNGTKSINLAVKRNLIKFPEDFYFQLTEEESKKIWFQIETKKSNVEVRGGKFDKPYVFTESGVAMLATVLHTPIAAEVSVSIMRAFVLMRKYIAKNTLPERLNNIEAKVIEHDSKFDKIFSMLETEKNNHIFFEGQVYDAYSLLLDILNKAEENIIIIDNYIDKKLLDVLSKTEKNIMLVTKNMDETTILKYKQQQYTNINIILKTNIHDRFIIIDNNILYHCGASFKDLGKKCFAISKFEDKKYLKELLEYIKL